MSWRATENVAQSRWWAKANGAGRGERGAEGGIDDDGAAADEG